MNWTPLATKTYEQIKQAGPLNNMDLLERLRCSRRGLYTVLGNMLDEGLIKALPDFRDMRRRRYVTSNS